MFKFRYRIAVLGAGNGGQAIAVFLAAQGHDVRLWNRSPNRLDPIRAESKVSLTGVISLCSKIGMITENLEEAVRSAHLIMVTTTADAHAEIALELFPLLEEGQIILLNPGRTGGALEVREIFAQAGTNVRVYVAEAQSLVYACRIIGPALVRVIGIKDYVPVAALPASDTAFVLSKVQALYPCYVPAENVLHTSFENIGAIFHPAIILFNTATIERGEKFYFYQDMTPSVADFLIQLDKERLALGEAFGIKLFSIFDWIKKAYPSSYGDTLCERMRSNPAYYQIEAPDRLDSRLLLEDIPTGLVPFIAFGQVVGLELPLMKSLVNVTCVLLKRDFWKEGRTLEKLGLTGITSTQIIERIL